MLRSRSIPVRADQLVNTFGAVRYFISSLTHRAAFRIVAPLATILFAFSAIHLTKSLILTPRRPSCRLFTSNERLVLIRAPSRRVASRAARYYFIGPPNLSSEDSLRRAAIRDVQNMNEERKVCAAVWIWRDIFHPGSRGFQ